MSTEEPTTWETYEEVARVLLEQIGDALGLALVRVDGKQKLVGQSGTTWEIDRKGVTTDGREIVAVECRRYTTSKLKQKDMAALAYTIRDVGAARGIVVTPKGVQEGARKIADYEGITIVGLDQDATRTDYVLSFLNNAFIGVSAPRATSRAIAPTVTGTGPTPPSND